MAEEAYIFGRVCAPKCREMSDAVTEARTPTLRKMGMRRGKAIAAM